MHHSDLIDREAASIDIVRAEEWRRKAVEDTRKQEDLYASTQFSSVLTWLNVQDYQQEDKLEQHLEQIHSNSCQWFRDHEKARLWLASSEQKNILWVSGNPGAGD